jgi:hypothetical protein
MVEKKNQEILMSGSSVKSGSVTNSEPLKNPNKKITVEGFRKLLLDDYQLSAPVTDRKINLNLQEVRVSLALLNPKTMGISWADPICEEEMGDMKIKLPPGTPGEEGMKLKCPIEDTFIRYNLFSQRF